MHVNVYLSLERRHLNQLHYKSAGWGPGLPDGTGLLLGGVEVVIVSEFLSSSCIECPWAMPPLFGEQATSRPVSGWTLFGHEFQIDRSTRFC